MRFLFQEAQKYNKLPKQMKELECKKFKKDVMIKIISGKQNNKKRL